MRHLLPIAFLLFLSPSLFSKHIIGGVISYECLGGGTYKFTMIMYRDCSDLTGANFDGNAPVSIYKGDDQFPIETLYLPFPDVTDIEPDINNSCLILPPNVCVEQGVYEFTYTFSDWPSEESYTLSYQRCCRNATVDNIQTPGQVGATFSTEITPFSQAECNNSPIFNSFPPIVICVGEELNFDHSATDADGDQLIYEMCEPLIGGGQGGLGGGNPDACNGITPDPACPPPYETVNYINPPYNVLTPLGGDPAVTIDPVTGFLSGVPIVQGQFVVGVCVREFRNGQLLSTTRRDFQFNVANCEPTVVAEIDATNQIDEDHYSITICNEFDIQIDNLSFQEQFIDVFYWEFEIDGQLDSYTEWSPTISFPAHGTYNGALYLNPGTDCGDTAYVEVKIFPEVVADFSFEYDTCIAGPVFYKDESYFVGGESVIAEWDWNFGEGGESTFHSPTHLYENPDDYLVTLKVTDLNGCEDITVKNITYKPVPALILVSPSDVVSCPPADVFFNNLSNPIDETYDLKWTFGDGGVSGDISPTHIYREEGVYDVSLEILSPEGCFTDTTYTQLIEIQAPPIADFSFDPPKATNIDPIVNFFDESENAAAWEWFINGNIASHDQNPVFNFQDTGWQEITLIITHKEDCQDTLTQFIDVEPLVFFNMPNAFTPNEDTVNDFFYGKGLMPGITNYEMVIWDRWGKTVFETKDPLVGWNGRVDNSGRQALAGVYVYTVSFTGPRGKEFEYKGYATLLR